MLITLRNAHHIKLLLKWNQGATAWVSAPKSIKY